MANVNWKLTIGQKILLDLVTILVPTPEMCKFPILLIKNYGKVVKKLSTLPKATQLA